MPKSENDINATNFMAGSSFPRLALTVEESRDWIRALLGFIDSHKELCNAHTVDFFTKEHWKVVVRDEWKDGLLLVEDTDCLVNPPLKDKRGTEPTWSFKDNLVEMSAYSHLFCRFSVSMWCAVLV